MTVGVYRSTVAASSVTASAQTAGTTTTTNAVLERRLAVTGVQLVAHEPQPPRVASLPQRFRRTQPRERGADDHDSFNHPSA